MIAVTLHVVATLAPNPAARNPLPYQQEPVMEFDRTPNIVRKQLSRKAIDQVDGFIAVPSDPGLGVDVDEEILQQLCVSHEESI